MPRLCPCCGLPARSIGWIASVTSDDRQVHGLVGICMRCIATEARLPRATRWKRSNRAIDRALANPMKFMCKTYPDIGAARLAQAMLQHPEHGDAMLDGLGWMEAVATPSGSIRIGDQRFAQGVTSGVPV